MTENEVTYKNLPTLCSSRSFTAGCKASADEGGEGGISFSDPQRLRRAGLSR